MAHQANTSPGDAPSTTTPSPVRNIFTTHQINLLIVEEQDKMITNIFKPVLKPVLKYTPPKLPELHDKFFHITLNSKTMESKLCLPKGLDAMRSASLVTAFLAGHKTAHEPFHKAEKEARLALAGLASRTCLGLAGLGLTS
ncbi:hypothetical protein B0T25DRAFT_513745 [Lasiosphaeria hispida]|uniref:Uncharacterized protein n=1 Tax=Lasiosphaeria hispida TaxID=260671 RepID=A0AAJ0MKI4_9PEZI|nr:hypothetical protein B0T25DRAFT_513745 [Lasiosphaeria hispida]